MPELPEVETTRLGVSPHITHRRLLNWEIRTRQLRWPVEVPEILMGRVVHKVSRRAKYLLIHFDIGALILHLGMSGSLRIVGQGANAGKHDHVDLNFDDEKILRLNDPRKFGSILYQSYPVEQHWLLEKLGPEPLSTDFSMDYLFDKRCNRKLAIKNFIMDGQLVVGVGNIYASEALFLAGIRPNIRAGSISKTRCGILVESIKHTLSEAIKAGGTTLRDFTNSEGKPGYFGQSLSVYGREGQPCYQCQTLIKVVKTGQRSSYYCPSCQK
ncbi:MAG: bifunctional DNA-formamidopyrimidine glycosylase/DNA-(apurinic or apyrimidinic site) lyase [Pseudomonadales bacterium]|nr:bifunctional DNA-formamidopyrimidine glycosylase/DNA-(apurinic or apyrimidinic site) lyase [Pseudomonadales bacterium]